jgi:hypothetical protein
VIIEDFLKRSGIEIRVTHEISAWQSRSSLPGAV